MNWRCFGIFRPVRLPGVRGGLAKRIVDKFGDKTFEIIEKEPERLAEVKGITEKKARAISEQFEEKREMRGAMLFLQEYGISNALAVKIYQTYGSALYEIVRENPYQMAEDISGCRIPNCGGNCREKAALRGALRRESVQVFCMC